MLTIAAGAAVSAGLGWYAYRNTCISPPRKEVVYVGGPIPIVQKEVYDILGCVTVARFLMNTPEATIWTPREFYFRPVKFEYVDSFAEYRQRVFFGGGGGAGDTPIAASTTTQPK